MPSVRPGSNKICFDDQARQFAQTVMRRTGILRAIPVFALLLCVLALAVPSNAQEELRDPVHMVTTEWPPYSGEFLPGKGLITIIVKGAFERASIQSTVTVIPWRRALQSMNEAKNPAEVIFPLYDSKERRKAFYLSQQISISPVGFVHVRGSSFDWSSLADIEDKVIGTVGGYVNTREFDAAVRSGKLTVITANDDLSLLRLLQAGRVDAVVMDQIVARQLLDTLPEFKPTRRLFVFHPHPLAYQPLYVGFRRNESGRKLRNLFNRGLAALRCSDNDCRNAWPRAPHLSIQ